jgi:dihydrofolate reductase
MSMTEVVYYVAASRDGFIAGPNHELDWLQAFEGGESDYGYADFLASVDGLVMGRSTYEVARRLTPDWPYGERPCRVLSRRPLDGAAIASVQAGAFDIDTLRRAWSAQACRRVWLVGGGDVAAQFARAGAIDEVVLSTVPVTLCSGIALFAQGVDGLAGFVDTLPPRQWANGLTQRVLRRAN